jgi:Ca2+-binding RTX toxin-like protein
MNSFLRKIWKSESARAKKNIRKRGNKVHLEVLEPRVLLSADLSTSAATALAGGLDQFGDRIDGYLDSNDLFSTQVPFIVQVQQTGDGSELVAPTLGSLFAVQVDTNGPADGGINATLDGLDADNDGAVDAGEFVQGWLFDKVSTYYGTTTDSTTTNFASWLDALDTTLTVDRPGGGTVTISLDVSNVEDLTESVPNADAVFGLDFRLSVTQNLAIDLGTEADALKLLYYTGSYESKASPVIPITSTLDFGFTFGVRTGGQESPGETLNAEDFFIREADDLIVSAKSDGPGESTQISGVDFHLNIGFLGAEVTGGDIDFKAAVKTLLIDPDSPEVLGFITDQYGAKEDGEVTATNPFNTTTQTQKLAHDAGFVLRIGKAGIATEVTVYADTTNTNATLDELVDDVNVALADAGLGDLIEATVNGSDQLVLTLIPTTDTPLGFGNESYNGTGPLSSTPYSGDATYPYEFGSDVTFLLSVEGALPKLVTVGFSETARTELGFGNTNAATLSPLTAESAPSAYVLTGNATFEISVRKDDGSVVSGTVVVTAADTAGNTDYYYLADDIITQIGSDAPQLSGLVHAQYNGTYMEFVPDGSVKAIEVASSGTAETEIGFATNQMSTLGLTADSTPVATFDLTSDAHINLYLSYAVGSDEYVDKAVSVTVPADENADADALAADINAAIDAALGVDKIDVEIDSSGKIVLRAKDTSVYALSTTTHNTSIEDLVADVQSALDQAGLGSLVTAGTDGTNLYLTSSGGKSLEITKTLTLDAGVTYTELQEPPAIGGTATEDLFAPEIDEAGSNIQFNLPVTITPGLNYTPSNVAMVGNFNPFERLLADPEADPPAPVVATIGDGDTRFELNFSYDPDIEHQDHPVATVPASSDLTEEIRLVNMAEPLNFNLVTAESMVGLIMGLGTALQQMVDSGLFSGYDIPFADASLSDLLNFTDSDKYVFSGLIDTLLIYDTGGNGIDESGVADPAPNDDPRLLQRIVDTKGTPETEDDDVYLIPNFVTAQDMAAKLAEILGVPLTGAGGINANYEPLFTLRAPESAVSNGILSAAATFNLTIDTGTGPSIIPITIAPDDTNMTVDDLAVDIDAALALAGLPIDAVAENGRIVLRAAPGNYIEAFGISNVNDVAQNELGFLPVQDATANELTYDVRLLGGGRTTMEFNAAFEYDVDLNPFVKMTVDSAAEADRLEVAMTGYTGLDMTFGIELSPPGAIIYGDTDLEDLNGGAGLDIKLERAVTGETGVRSVLSGNAIIVVQVYDSSSLLLAGEGILVDANLTLDNKTTQDFAQDIQTVLSGSTIADYVDAKVIDGKLALVAKGSAASLTVYANTVGDPAWTELGFSPYAVSGRAVSALKAPAPMIGRLTGTATFEIDILKNSLGNPVIADPVTVTLLASATTTNKTPGDLVADVNNALVAAGLGGMIKAGYDSSSVNGVRLVLSAVDPDIEFTVRAANAVASGELSISSSLKTADKNDFVIYDSSGGVHRIALDGGPDGLVGSDVDALIAHINAETGGAVIADFNSTQTGLQLFDTTSGTGQFRVETINGSGAILTLGFFGAGNTGTQNTFGDGDPKLIEGGPIGLTHLDDRFFVRDAQLWGALVMETPRTPEGEVEMYPPGVPGSGLFGIVGVDTNLQGEIYAEFTADIKDPATGYAGQTATLLELFQGAIQGRLTQDATFEVTVGEGSAVNVTVLKSDTADNKTLSDLVIDVNKSISATTLNGTIAARATGTRIEFYSLSAFTITPAGTGAAELGLELELSSKAVNGEQVLTAHSASRYAVTEPVVTTASELSYSTGEAPFTGGFTPGQVVVGYDQTQTEDGEGNIHIDYTETGRAIILGVGPGVLTVANIEGDFGTADQLRNIDWTVSAYHTLGEEATPKANFGEFDLSVTVQPGFDDLGFGDGFLQFVNPGGTGVSSTVTFKLTDFGNPYDPTEPEAKFDNLAADVGDLYALKDLDYGDIGNALEELLALLKDVDANFALLNTPLPAINRSVGELLNLVGGFERGVENIGEAFAASTLALEPGVDIPPLTLQDIPNALRSAFGLPDNVIPDPDDPLNPSDSFTVDWVKLDFNKATKMLLMDLSLQESISTKLGLDIPISGVDDEGVPFTLPNLTSVGVLKVNGNLDINFNVGIDLVPPIDKTKPNSAYLFKTSSIAAKLHVEGEGQQYANGEDGMGLVFRAALGPLAVFVQDGDALIDVAFKLGMNFGGADKKLISSVDANRTDKILSDFATPVILAQEVNIVLPMFYGGEGPNDYIGDFSAIGNLNSLTIKLPSFSDIRGDIVSGVIVFDPIDNILLAVDTLNAYLESLSDILADEVLGINLPFVGDQLADLLFIETFRNTLYTTLKNGIENDIDLDPELDITTLLQTALAGYLVGSIEMTSCLTGDVSGWYRQWNFTISPEKKKYIISDFDLGIDNLGFDIDSSVEVEFDWTMDIGFGVNFVEGAYIDLAPADGVELDLDLVIKIPELASNPGGNLGFLPLNVAEDDSNPDTPPTTATGADIDFAVNIRKGADTVAPRLGFSDIGDIDAYAVVKGTPLAGATSAVTLNLVTRALLGLPSLGADLVIDWSLPTGTVVSTLGGDAVAPGVTYMALNNMTLDAGSVAESLLGPLFEDIIEFIEPFMPVIDTLTYPIPILSDIAGEPFTLLDLAGIFGSVDPAFIEAVADILDVISGIVEFVNAPPLPLGSLVLFDPDASTPILNFDPMDSSDDLADISVLLTTLDGTTTPGWTFDEAAYNAAINSSEFLKAVRDGELADGLTMPILTDPRQGVMLLLNQNAVMIDYLLPPLMVDFEYLQVFPVWGPLAVSIEISFGFTLDLHSVGFDTYGYQRYADGGFRNELVIFDGFYLNDLNEEGVDAPEVLFEFGLVGAAELNLGIARAGVGGGINSQIYFDWYDAIPDGRVHVSEMWGSMWANDYNPLAVFDVGGAMIFQMFAFLEISLLGIDMEFPITPETELFSFEIDFDRPPILANQTGSTLILNIGPNAEDRLNGNTSDGHEGISVEYSGGKVLVWSNSLGVSKDDAQEFSGISHIVGIGDQGNDTISMNLSGSNITYELEGGLGDDVITVTGGSGGGTIKGGVGNDVLTGGDGDDIINGEEGNDTINGSGGYDILFGDFGRVFENIADPDPLVTSRITGSDGNDSIIGGADDDIIFGGGGNDTLDGEAGNDLVIGDGGRFAFIPTGGRSHFLITDVLPASAGYTPPGIDTYVDPGTISQNIDAIAEDLAGIFSSIDLGIGGNDLIKGGTGDDLLFGGTADDLINGDAGDDIILGGKGFDEIYGGTKGTSIDLDPPTTTDKDVIFGGDQADVIYGNEDDDIISGGSGNDYIHGNAGNDVMKGDSGADIMFGDDGNDLVFGQTEPDILMGGVGNDLVVGGTGSDIMFGDDGLVAKLDPNTGAGVKVIYNTLAFDSSDISPLLTDAFYDNDIRTVDLIATMVVADDGNDKMSGDAGDDLMFGGGGNDLMGGDVDPRLGTFVRPTSISEDVLIGDGGQIVFDQRRYKSIATLITDTSLWPVLPDDDVYGFVDTIHGDNGNDFILGGQGGDILAGGHGPDRGATDEGASDNDVIIGDNGELGFADNVIEENFGRLEFIRTTDKVEDTGGADTAYGEEGADIILGGVNSGGIDSLYGDYYDYSDSEDTPTIITGDDVILGDNGELRFSLPGGMDYQFRTDTNLGTLDLIRSYRDGLGGTDAIAGSQGGDVLIGGTGGDEMYGDDEFATNGNLDGEEIMLGDNGDIWMIGLDGRLKVRVADMASGTAVDLITTTDTEEATGGADNMSGNAGNDIMLGGVHGDIMYGDQGYGDGEAPDGFDADDIMLGDNGLLDFTYDTDLDRNTLDLIHSEEDGLGGIDVISGNTGLDVAIGGTDDDTIYGDDALASAGAADLGDLLLGDNADIFLMAKGSAVDGDLKTVLDSAVYLIRTTDEEHPEYGGSDTISGNAGGDIIAGGVFGDKLYGDRELPESTAEDDGDDIMLGDNGAFEWLSTGRFEDINPDSLNPNIDISSNNSDLWNKFGGGLADTDLTTLDLITTEQPTRGGRDLMYGDNGRDMMFGGTDSDEMYGDDGDGIGAADNNDLMFGDHGRLYPQFSALREPETDWREAFHSRNFFAINVGDTDGGEGDRMWGEEGDDGMLGQQGDDRMWGGSGDDDMIGGHNVSGGIDELKAPDIKATLGSPIAMPDIDKVNDLMDGGSGNDAMAGDNAIVWRRGDDLSPRFRELTENEIYTTTDKTITANVDLEPDGQSDPNNVVGRDIELVDHADTTAIGLYGADVMAGGADNDVMFGQLANDLMQGDGFIGADDGFAATITFRIDVADSTDPLVNPPDTDETLYFNINIPEAATDGDDYLEGNGGGDLMYGGLGQDDIIGGSSALFGLTTEAMRPDASDVIFGGAGIDIGRNHIGDATEDVATGVITTGEVGHARDADFIMGDNANVYRLVNAATDEFLTFNYDNYDKLGIQKIIPRAMQQLDYTLGGADYWGGSYGDGVAQLPGQPADNGAADLIHGEAGDDVIFGMTGSDVIFGEGQDDDIVGGYGNDWISGGTGQDGVLGDDGLILTSRNSTAGEPLYGIAGLLAKDPRPKYSDGNVLNEIIYTPGSIQYALINVEGELKKTMDLVPFSFDKTWIGNDDEFPENQDNQPFADDIIFGGLGSDWLHGGSGDDAISGAEALDHAYVPIEYQTYIIDGREEERLVEVLDLGYLAVGLPTTTNPGDVLAFNPMDADGQHTNNRFRAGEFALYNEYDPRLKIMLEFYDTNPEDPLAEPEILDFLLNFNTNEGVIRPAGTVPKATGQQTESYPQVWDDGRDAIFGDLGNDWLVGGTGADDMYGGWGNDLLNADDDHDTNGGLNDIPDTHPFYQDRAYGGAGRDVLIGNTGGDRLIDWVGEYNSYLVPYAPFGAASVSRTLQPFLPEFLYALSASDGADFTRQGDDARNGEPEGEMGLVLQKDYAWQDQTGAPADPQAGNIPGGARDVLRSAGFNDGSTDAFFVDSGIWTVAAGRYQVAPTSLGGDALSVFYVDDYIPSYFEMMATIRAVKPTGGYGANAYLVFDYQSADNFKFAGINVSTSKLEIGYRDASGWHVLIQVPYTTALKADTDYNVFLALNGSTATLRVNNKITLNYTFGTRVDEYGVEHFLNEGMVGLGANNAKAAIDNVVVQRIAPEMTAELTVDFSSPATVGTLFPGGLTIVDNRFGLTATAGAAIELADMTVAPASVLGLEGVFKTAGQGGFVFDCYGPEDFKFVALSEDTGQVMVGHSTARYGVVIDAAWVRTIDAGTDYTLGLTIAERTVSVTLNGAAVSSFAFNALITDGAFGFLSLTGETSFKTLVVRTDDPAYSTPVLPKISVSDKTVTEGDGTFEVTFILSAPSEKEVRVDYTTVAGTANAGEDYAPLSGTLTFAPGETSRTVTFGVIDDLIIESAESFGVELSNAVNAAILDGAATVTITDNDIDPALPSLSINDLEIREGGKTNATKATLTITLSKASLTEVRVNLYTEDDSAVKVQDYVEVSNLDPATITFAPGETKKTFTVLVNGDKVAEFNEVFYVHLSDAVGASIADGIGTITIKTDDGTPLTAAMPASGEMEGVLATEADLAPIIDAAIALWAEALGEEAVSALHDVEFQVGDLSGQILGLSGNGTVFIDADAAGYGWFVDPTPLDDSEFTGGTADGMDLLTAVMHEFGHVLGFRDVPAALDSLMSGTIEEGVRRLPSDLAMVTMPATAKSSLLNFAPPSNGIPSGWIFEHGKVADDSGHGWLGKILKRFTGRTNHGGLPSLITLTSGAALHNPVEGVAETAEMLVRLDMASTSNLIDNAALKHGKSWQGEFLLDGTAKANPNKGIKIVI